MPFVISHGPDMQAVGSIALQTGNAAYYNQVRREREAQVMQERNQQRAIYANLVQQGVQLRAQRERQILDQDFARQQTIRQQDFQREMFRTENEAGNARILQQQAWQDTVREAQNKFQAGRQEAEFDFRWDSQQAGQEFSANQREGDRRFQWDLADYQQTFQDARHQEEMAREDQRIAMMRQQAAEMRDLRDYQAASSLFDQEGEMVGQVDDLVRQGWGFQDGGQAWKAWQDTRTKIATNPTLRATQKAEALLMHARTMPIPDKEPEPPTQEIIDNQVKWIQDESGRKFPVKVKRDKEGQWDVEFPSGWQNYGADSEGGYGGAQSAKEAEDYRRHQELAAKALQPRGELGEAPTPEQINAYADKLAGRNGQAQGGGAGPGQPGRTPTRYVQPRIQTPDLDEQIARPTNLTDDLLRRPKQLKVGAVYGPRWDPEVEEEVLYQWNGRDFDRIAPWRR